MRGIVLARFANLIDGHAAVTPDLVRGVSALLAGEPLPVLRLLMMVAVAYSEEARANAQPPIVARGGPGQNDVAAPDSLAWTRQENVARCLDASLAVLAAAAARSLEQEVEPSLRILRDARPRCRKPSLGPAAGDQLERLKARVRD